MSFWSSSRSLTTGDRGRFIVFEGIDGSGKSTQASLLVRRIEDLGIPVLLTAEPSDGPAGRIIRSLKARPDPEEEAELFSEDRRHHVENVILPALRADRWVICDRYLYSSLAYQGSRGLSCDRILGLNTSFALAPDVIFLVEIDVETALARIMTHRSGNITLFEQRESLEKVAAVYQSILDPLVERIDGNRSIEEIHAVIMALLQKSPAFEELARRTAFSM
jgi:dTMP kinase